MGKDRKQKALAKYKHGLVSWEDVPEELKKQADRHNFDGGELRAEKEKNKDKDSEREMRRQINEYKEKED